MSLTTIQSEILTYIKSHLENQGVAPSTSQICTAFGFKSFGTVARHMKRLEEKGYLKRAGRRNKQGVLLTSQPRATSIPLVGTVAAGLPIEAISETDPACEQISVPDTMVGSGDHFALRVKGNSMVEDGIHDGDMIVVRRQNRAQDGETVVALIDSEATVKRFYRHDQKGDQKIELRPANSQMQPIWVSGNALKNFQIQGIVVGLFRHFA